MTVAMSSRPSSKDCPPRFGTPRSANYTHGGDVAQFSLALGRPFMPWQRHVADVALEVDPATGLLRYRNVVLTVPRQSGKTAFLLALILWRSLSPRLGGHQQIAFTAQTALDARDRLQNEWEPQLRRSPFARTYRPSWKTGKESLFFHDGSRLQIVATTEKGGHGTTLDMPIIDEAFAQPDDRLEVALSPTMLTRSQPQMWVVSTAGKTSASWFGRQVAAGRSAVGDPDSTTAFFEWSAGDDDDPLDPATWWRCMPALGETITERAVRAELEKAQRDEEGEGFAGFVRTMLNRAPDVGRVAQAFDMDRWRSLADPDAERGARPVFAVASAPDRSWTAIAVAWRRSDDLVQVMTADYRPGDAWVPARIRELQDRWSGRVLVDPSARGLVQADPVPAGKVASAHNWLAAAVTAGTLRHSGQGELETAVRGARWRLQGAGRVLDRFGGVDVSPLMAAALAAHAADESGAPALPPNLLSAPAGGALMAVAAHAAF